MNRVSLLVVLFSVLFSLSFATDFHDHKVIRAKIEDKEVIPTLNSWDLDVWSYDSNLIVGLNDIRASGDDIKAIEELGIEYTVLVDDVQVMLEKMAQELQAARASEEAAADWFVAYHTLAEINAFYTNLTTTFPKLITKVPTIGRSIQGNSIDAYVLTGTSGTNKKKIIFTAMQHAREWINPHTLAYVVNNLVNLYATDSRVANILNSIEFYIVPIVNPDGYLYTWTGTSNRLWRKNRRPNSGGTYGVDLNRNWASNWGGEGSSGTPSSDTYRGTKAFSEPETGNVSNYILGIVKAGTVAGYIDFHSYSQLILRPYGWTKTLPPDATVQKTVGDGMAAAIKSINGLTYTSQAAWELYFASGTADDWAYEAAKIVYSYTIELRDTGTYGFQLPANQIIPQGREIWASMLYYAEYIIKNA